MKVENGKIVEATEDELYAFWLDNWSEIYDFNDYKRRVQLNGTTIINTENDYKL